MKIFVEADADLCLSRRSKAIFPFLFQSFGTDVELSKSFAMSVREEGPSKALSNNGSLS